MASGRSLANKFALAVRPQWAGFLHRTIRLHKRPGYSGPAFAGAGLGAEGFVLALPDPVMRWRGHGRCRAGAKKEGEGYARRHVVFPFTKWCVSSLLQGSLRLCSFFGVRPGVSPTKRRSAVAVDPARLNSQPPAPGTIGKSGLCITSEKLDRLLLCPV